MLIILLLRLIIKYYGSYTLNSLKDGSEYKTSCTEYDSATPCTEYDSVSLPEYDLKDDKISCQPHWWKGGCHY